MSAGFIEDRLMEISPNAQPPERLVSQLAGLL
jgi:hypothetical protein